MDRVQIDVRDIDYSWTEHVDAFVDRDFNLYHFPRRSVERLGEFSSNGDADLLDGHVPARAETIEVDGDPVKVWTVGNADLVTRPSRRE